MRATRLFDKRATPLPVIAAAALLGACVVDMDADGPPIQGTSGDVETAPGTYTGYRVVMPCDARHVNIGVIGTGSLVLADVDDISAAGQELAASLRDITSIHTWGGYGLSCEPGIGTSLSTDNWTDVDTIITRVGEYLREHDYGLQVGIRVETIAVPH